MYYQNRQLAKQNSVINEDNLDLSRFSGNQQGTYDNQTNDFLMNVIDVKDLIADFEHRVLRGEYQSANMSTGEVTWIKMVGNDRPIINEIGIRELIGRITSKVNRQAKLTFKTEEEIYKDMFHFDMSITELISKRADYWNLDIETAKSIKDSCIELAWDCATCSRDGFTAINLKTQYSRQEVGRIDQAQQQEGGGKKTVFGISIPFTGK